MEETRTGFGDKETSMTLTRNDFGKIARNVSINMDDTVDSSMTMTNTDFGKIDMSADMSMTMGKEDFEQAVGVNLSTGKGDISISENISKANTSLLSSAKKRDRAAMGSPVGNKVFSKILTPRKSEGDDSRTAASPFSAGPRLSTFSVSTLSSSPGPSSSSDALEELLNGSVHVKNEIMVDDDRFSFARFLQLANIPPFNPSRPSIGYVISPSLFGSLLINS